MVTLTTPESVTRSARLTATTDALHQHLHALVAQAAPFEDRERYGRFVVVQYQFQAEIEPLYGRASLQALIPDLGLRSRRAAAAADLGDLGLALPEVPASDTAAIDDHQALGWLFVSEGSTLGAAILLKRVQALGLTEACGARYLAPAPQGRARWWRQFVDVLDGLSLTAAQDAQVTFGADAAFRRFAERIGQNFGS